MKKRILQLCAVVALGLVTSVTGQSLTNDNGDPIEATEGTTVDLDYTYESSVPVYMVVELWDTPSLSQPFLGDFVGKVISSQLPINIGAPTSGTVTLPVPTVLSEDLAPGNFYVMNGKLTTDVDGTMDAGQYWDNAGNYPVLEVVATLSNNNFNVGGDVALFHSASNQTLELIDIQDQKLDVYSVTGQRVLTIDNANAVSSVDVSFLNAGMYFVSNGNSVLKFIK